MNNEQNVHDVRNQPFFIAQQKQDNACSMQECHYHDVYEIYYLLECRRNYFIHNRTYPVVKGDIVLINVHDIHKTMNSHHASYERILICFQKDFLSCMAQQEENINLLECFSGDRKVIRLKLTEQAFVQSILLKMVDEDKMKPHGYLTCQKILLAELLLFINRNMEQFRQDERHADFRADRV
jgi:hypothetical protein